MSTDILHQHGYGVLNGRRYCALWSGPPPYEWEDVSRTAEVLFEGEEDYRRVEDESEMRVLIEASVVTVRKHWNSRSGWSPTVEVEINDEMLVTRKREQVEGPILGIRHAPGEYLFRYGSRETRPSDPHERETRARSVGRSMDDRLRVEGRRAGREVVEVDSTN